MAGAGVQTRIRGGVVLGLWLVAAGCDAGRDAEIQALPPLEQPSAEARAKLPELQGRWNFAGWELGRADTAAARAGLARPGGLTIGTQRLDSLAGSYGAAPLMPLVGEVRRSGLFSLIAADPEAGPRYLAGAFRRDTLWLELTSLAVADAWPAGTRAAFVRDSVAEPFVRLPGGAMLLQPRPDTAAVVLPPNSSAGVTSPIPAAESTPPSREGSPDRSPIRPTAPDTSPPATRQPTSPPRAEPPVRDTAPSIIIPRPGERGRIEPRADTSTPPTPPP